MITFQNCKEKSWPYVGIKDALFIPVLTEDPQRKEDLISWGEIVLKTAMAEITKERLLSDEGKAIREKDDNKKRKEKKTNEDKRKTKSKE